MTLVKDRLKRMFKVKPGLKRLQPFNRLPNMSVITESKGVSMHKRKSAINDYAEMYGRAKKR